MKSAVLGVEFIIIAVLLSVVLTTEIIKNFNLISWGRGVGKSRVIARGVSWSLLEDHLS